MDISIMDVIGPVMIGPSSSHTAGAARLGAVARHLCTKPFGKVVFGLHGSFAKTYKGHGTDFALLGGVLGLQPDDERIREAFILAGQEQLSYEFVENQIDGVHENTVRISFYGAEGLVQELVGSSIGGGRIFIHTLNGCRVGLTGESPAVIIRHNDCKGVLSRITRVLAEEELNLGTLQLTRTAKGKHAFSIIEVDEPFSRQAVMQLREIPEVVSVQVVQAGTEVTADVS